MEDMSISSAAGVARGAYSLYQHTLRVTWWWCVAREVRFRSNFTASPSAGCKPAGVTEQQEPRSWTLPCMGAAPQEQRPNGSHPLPPRLRSGSGLFGLMAVPSILHLLQGSLMQLWSQWKTSDNPSLKTEDVGARVPGQKQTLS